MAIQTLQNNSGPYKVGDSEGIGCYANITVVSGTTHTATEAERGTIYVCTNASDCTITFPDALPVGFWASLFAQNSGKIIVDLDTDTATSSGSYMKVEAAGGGASIFKYGATTWGLTGQLVA